MREKIYISADDIFSIILVFYDTTIVNTSKQSFKLAGRVGPRGGVPRFLRSPRTQLLAFKNILLNLGLLKVMCNK